MVPSNKKMFLEKKQVRDMTNTKHDLKRKQLKYKAVDTTKKQDMLNNKGEQYKTIDTAEKQDLFKKKSRTIQNNEHC